MKFLGYCGVILTKPRLQMLHAMATDTNREWTIAQLRRAAGTAEATTYQSLKAFREADWVSSRNESDTEYHQRWKDLGEMANGPRITLWKLTETGQLEVNLL